MPIFLDSSNVGFPKEFSSFLGQKRESDADVEASVRGILSDVSLRGDAALIELTARWDRLELTAESLAIDTSQIERACSQVSDAERNALELASQRIRAYHERQLPTDERWTDQIGAELGWRWTPVDTAGLYVPGGLASYPSSVLMNAIPARVAGVERLIMCAPTPDGVVNPLVLLAASISGVDTIYRIGGAQAIAAMAFGTETIDAVDKITGPGNAWVAAAKRQVFGRVGIDMVAGPSEILILADAGNDPNWVALDLLAQAEHDEAAQAILITDSNRFANAVANAVEEHLTNLERHSIAIKSWRDFGAIITVRDWTEATELSDRIAPEHLEILTSNAEELADNVKHAGAIFIGPMTPEAIGDYIGGPNHVLPTARSARFSSGLSVLDFMKRTTISRLSPSAMASLGPSAACLARSESLEAHGLSVLSRLERLNR